MTEIVNVQRPALHAGHANLNLGGSGLQTNSMTTNTVVNRTIYADDMNAKMNLNEGSVATVARLVIHRGGDLSP